MTPSPPDAAPDDLDHAVAAADAFVLDPAVVHLNHGSFGACPRAALDVQAAWRARLEAATMRFFVLDGQPALDDARAEVAGFVGADPAGLVFVANATAGVATALDGLVGDGDEVVTIDHGYAACRHGLERLVARRGGRVVTAHVAFPVRDPAQHVDAIVAACTPETRVVLLDHVTSPTALILDVAAIARALAPRGVHVVVDGAHAPGMLDLDVAALAAAGVAAYVGNLHKWACAPKACALLWVRDDLRRRIRPLVTSHGAALAVDDPRRFHAEHDWTGTSDPSAWLSVPSAIAFMGSLLPGGWPALRLRRPARGIE